MPEFSIIKQYFEGIGADRTDVLLGIGDDAAIVKTDDQQHLAISVDTLVSGVHFPHETSAYNIGWKSLAVNLSDMAAMGATPSWMTLALTLPESNQNWLAEFSRGLSDLALQHSVALVGGDTTQGPLSITINIFGLLEPNIRLKRNAAQVGDSIYVSGVIGDAALGLKSLNEKLPLSSVECLVIQHDLNRPVPRVNEMSVLKPYINAAIDISDGLAADLEHILTASQKGAIVNVQQLPVSQSYRWCCQGENAFDIALTGGDDYEICMTVAEKNEAQFLEVIESLKIDFRKIGEVTEASGLQFVKNNGEPYVINSKAKAYQHFT